MARNKTCPPGVICIESLTMLLLLFFLGIVAYFYISIQNNKVNENKHNNRIESITSRNIHNIQYMPVNIETQPQVKSYQQVGILSRNRQEDVIMPLYGRHLINGRDKWQYYTVSGGGAGGNLQTKLPVRVKNKTCSGEYGCDEIYTNDDVYVEGFNDNFKATVYDNGLFSYLPF